MKATIRSGSGRSEEVEVSPFMDSLLTLFATGDDTRLKAALTEFNARPASERKLITTEHVNPRRSS